VFGGGEILLAAVFLDGASAIEKGDALYQSPEI
jgi:hypothetical protein